MPNYARKKDLKKKIDLSIYLKSDIDKLDTDKLKNVSSNLSNLKSKALTKNLIKNVISNKTKHLIVENELNELLEKVEAI